MIRMNKSTGKIKDEGRKDAEWDNLYFFFHSVHFLYSVFKVDNVRHDHALITVNSLRFKRK